MFRDQKSGTQSEHISPCFVCDIRHNDMVTSNLAFHRPIR